MKNFSDFRKKLPWGIKWNTSPKPQLTSTRDSNEDGPGAGIPALWSGERRLLVIETI